MTTSPLTIRSADTFDVSGDGRTIEGIAVRWDVEALVTDDGKTRYYESYDRRSVANSLKQRGPIRPLFLRHAHLRGSLGETRFAVSAEGLMFTARAFAESSLADEVLADGVGPHGRYPAVSIGHYPLRPRPTRHRAGEHVHRLEVALEELSLAEVGQHSTAKVLAVRAGTPQLDALRRRLATLPNW